MKLRNFIALGCAVAFLSACTSTNEKQIGEMLKKNPSIITEAIKANPVKFIDALNDAVKAAQSGQAKRREEEEKKKLEESFNKPLKAEIRKDELLRGTKGAPITLIEYSDFECPFCTRGYKTVLELLKKYKGKIQFVFKHLPLSFHPNAMPASQYYEALRLQSDDLAIKFHDDLFENQSKIKNGEKYFKAISKKIGADMARLAKDINSDVVKKRIQQDLDEAKKFGFQGTPGFLLNGIPVKGAYPVTHFESLIAELKKRGKLNL